MNGIKNFKSVALDSNIFIYLFQETPEFIEKIRELFKLISEEEISVVTSIISVLEALSYPSPNEVLKDIKTGFYTLPMLEILDVNKKIAFSAADIRREYRFRTPDAIQLATALEAKAQVFITNDSKLKKFREIKVVTLSEI